LVVFSIKKAIASVDALGVLSFPNGFRIFHNASSLQTSMQASFIDGTNTSTEIVITEKLPESGNLARGVYPSHY
jgi:hypothetical protein